MIRMKYRRTLQDQATSLAASKKGGALSRADMLELLSTDREPESNLEGAHPDRADLVWTNLIELAEAVLDEKCPGWRD